MKLRIALVGALLAIAGGLHAANQAGPFGELDVSQPGLSENLVLQPNGTWALKIDDMLIPVDFERMRSGSCCTLWTNGVVYYQFNADLSETTGIYSGNVAQRKAAFETAVQAWEDAVPGLTFVEGTGSGYYIDVMNDGGNWSYLGMIHITYQPQQMGIYNWDWTYIIAHEIGHALGLIHEQSRTDRDTYVTVNYDNIQDDKEYNYDIDAGSTAHGNYDYGSVMHYYRCGFFDTAEGTKSCGDPPADGYTMDAVPAGAAAVGMTESEANNAMGQRSQLSSGDIAGVRSMYPSNDEVFADDFERGNATAWSATTRQAAK